MISSELRIGNYIFDDEGILSKINGFQPYGHSIRCDQNEGCELLIDLYPQDGTIKKGYEIDINTCKPIPLTEEWLLKLGFKKYPNLRDTFRQEYYDAFKLDIDKHTIISFSIPIGYDHNIRCNYDKLYRSEEKKQSYRVKYVHQLQNLYFALTGEELKIK